MSKAPRSTTNDPAPADVDEISDRQHVDGPVEECELTEGAVLITDIGEALREVRADGAIVVLHVTVEDASFAHN